MAIRTKIELPVRPPGSASCRVLSNPEHLRQFFTGDPLRRAITETPHRDAEVILT